MTLTEREKACADINAIYFAHLFNYGNWNAEATLTNWYDKAKPKLSRKEWDDLAREVKAFMKEREQQSILDKGNNR